MGNNASSAAASSGTSQESTKALRTRLNLIATRFILSSDFKSLKMLVDEKYCDDLSIITKDLLSSRFTSTQIKNLAKSDTVFYISKRELAQIEANTKDKKNSTCKRIARFYVRIAHLFASIITTVYPRWSDNDSSAAAFEGADFCKARIDALMRSASAVAKSDGSGSDVVSIQPTVCSLYSTDSSAYAAPGFSALELLYNDEYDETSGTFNRRSGAMQSKYDSDLASLYTAFTSNPVKPPEIKSFSDINIVALSKRFMECGPKKETARTAAAPAANESSGEDGDGERPDRSQERQQQQQQQYQRGGQDHGYRYSAPKPTANDAAKELSRIKNDAEAKEKYIKDAATNMSGAFTYPTSVKKTGSFSRYAVHVKTMIANAEKSKAMLLGVIDKLFLILKTENDAGASAPNQAKITIHPALTSELLDQLVNQTRDIILQMYLGCERDFYTGIKLLRVMIEEKMQETMEAALLKLQSETKLAVKSVSQRQFIKKETDLVRQQSEVSDIQSFKNPLYDDESQKIRAQRDADKYNSVLQLQNEIKNLEAKLSSTKKDVDLLENQKQRYQNQKKLMDANGETDKSNEIEKEIQEIRNKRDEAKTVRDELDVKIKEQQQALKDLQLSQLS